MGRLAARRRVSKFRARRRSALEAARTSSRWGSNSRKRARSEQEADRIGSPRIDLEVMGLRLTAPVELSSATPTRQHVMFCFEVRISAYPVALIGICEGVALRITFLE